MKRRSIIIGFCLPTTSTLSGCINSNQIGDNRESSPDNADESDDTDESDMMESDDPSESDPNESDGMVEEAGAQMISVWLQVVDDVPEDEKVISASDDGLDRVPLISDVFSEFKVASQEMSEEELAEEYFTAGARRESNKGQKVLEAKSELPLTERTIYETEEGVYVELRDHVLFLYFREYSED